MSVGIEYLFDLCKREIALFSYIIEMVSIQQKRVFKRNGEEERGRGTEQKRNGEQERRTENITEQNSITRALGHKLSWVEHYNKSLK